MPFQYPSHHLQQQQPQHFYAPQVQSQRPPYYYDDLSWQQSYPMQPPTRPNLVETKYIVKKNGPMGSSSQANAAASFFAKAQQKLHLNNNGDLNTGSSGCSSPPTVAMRHNNNATEDSSEERQQFPTNFKAIVHRSPPPIPGQLLRRLELNTASGDSHQLSTGKIRVILRVAKSSCLSTSVDGDTLGNQIFQMDRRRKQLTMYDPSVFRNPSQHQVSLEERKVGVAAPKMFAFDNVFTDQDSQEEVANSALSDIIASVVNGNDGCLFCFGHANLGKSRSMLGSDESSKSMGIIPIAIAWLYRAIKEKKTRTGARFSIRVSALEVTSQRENLRDLLEPYSSENDQSPGVYLRNLPINRLSAANPSAVDYLANQSELRASSADKAAYYLDAALASRSADTRGRESHLLFTLHVYQYSVMGAGPSGVSGGRSRLHLIDFGGCERTKTPGGGITLSGLGNVILGIFNGQKHLPHRESKVTQLLRECLGSLTCQATMLAHVSPEPSHYSETLHTVQLASRLHRMRRKRMKSSGHHRRSSSNGSRSGSGSSSGLTTSTNASSSEFSCDTVVYRGQSDGSGTDSEHPPSMLLRTSRNGSLDDIPRPASSNGGRRRKILTNGAISPRQCLSPTPYLPRSPASLPASSGGPRSNSSMSGSFLPAIPEVNYSGKMPLSGLVPAQSSHRLRQLQQQQKWVEQTNSNCNSPKRPGSRQEIAWMDPTEEQKKYGFMDEHKASMINNWVERQTTSDSNQVFMTQFKQVESDESIKEKAIVHLEQPVKKIKPPPPPRRTPPRETSSSLVTALSDSIPMIDDAEVVQVEQEQNNVATAEMSCQVNELELSKNHVMPPEPHPLRILSEENLTIVSSFAGSLNELPGSEDDEKIDASKLSFFQVPDFAALEKDSDRIKQTFQDFEDLQNNKNNSNDSESADLKSCYQDPRFKMDSSDEKLHTFSQPRLELITPQKQFLILSQSLRHPDGSSNPELNVISNSEKPMQRSPGNGRSSSDLENDNATIAVTSPNNNSAPMMPIMNCDSTVENVEKPSEIMTSDKKSSKFSFRFLRFFGSTRSKKSASDNGGQRRAKSVDRKVENSQVQKVMQAEVRSSSSSPMAMQKSTANNAPPTNIEDPSMLSAISTEWEFEPQEDEANGNATGSTLFENIVIQKKSASKDRKSSGYDSLGGDESSSLDSNEPPKSIKLSREMNNSLAKAFFAARGGGGSGNIEPQYSMPTDYYSNRNTSMNIMQYDELDILRMEQRQQMLKKF